MEGKGARQSTNPVHTNVWATRPAENPDEDGSRKRARTEDVLEQMLALIQEQRVAMQNFMTQFASSAAPGDVLMVPQQQPVQKFVQQDTQEVRNEQLPAHIEKQLMKTVRSFETDLRKFVNMQHKVEQAKQDYELMKADGHRYPTGTRPFKSPVELEDLDNVLSECSAGPSSFSVAIPQGTTKRQAMLLIHHSFTKFYKRCIWEALQVQMDAKKDLTTKAAFIAKCQAKITEQTQFEGCGLEDSDLANFTDEVVVAKCQTLYHDVVNKVRKEKTEEKKLAERKAADERKAQNDLASKEPAVLLSDLVGEMVQQNMQSMNVDSTDQQAKQATSDSSSKSIAFVQALQQQKKPKNSKTPRGGAGEGKGKGHGQQQKQNRNTQNLNGQQPRWRRQQNQYVQPYNHQQWWGRPRGGRGKWHAYGLGGGKGAARSVSY